MKMKIGIAGPVDISLLNIETDGNNLTQGYGFPLYSILINNLLDKGYEVVVFTLSTSVNQVLVLQGLNLTVCIVPRKHRAGRRFFSYEIKMLTNFMVKYKPDLIHGLWSYEFALAALKTKLPCVITLQDHATTILKLHFDAYRIARWIMNYVAVSKSKFLIVNSGYLYSLLNSKQKEKARIVHNFYSKDLEEYFAYSNKKKNYILSVSNGFGKRKNIQSGILAFSILKKKYKDLRYKLVGIDMEEGGPAHQFAIDNNAEEGIDFVGKLQFNEVITEIIHANVVLHPSLEESFGMSVLESMVIGTPVVGGKDSGNVPYLLSYGKTGRICDVTDPEDISKEISFILDNDNVANDIRIKSFEFAKENFNEELIVQQHIDVYNYVLENW